MKREDLGIDADWIAEEKTVSIHFNNKSDILKIEKENSCIQLKKNA